VRAVPDVGFLTDTTLCIGCKACEVACKQWNRLPADGYQLSGNSYDNTGWLSGTTWRHVQFIETFSPDRSQGGWLLMSDVCKHCVQAACLEVCPTGAIIRTEFDTVFIQPDVCNGCRDCIAACPFGVIEIHHETKVAQKCTLCYDRLQNGLEPACAKACPTESIQFGEVDELLARADRRVQQLKVSGQPAYQGAYLYGKPGDGYTDDIGGLNAFFLLLDRPEKYNLPVRPQLASRATGPSQLGGVIAGALVALGAAISFRNRGARRDEEAASTAEVQA
jgi:formate dehydrogenase iron-sulfur subunit